MNDSNLTNVGTTTSKIEAHDRGDVTRTELLVVTVMLSVFSVTGTIGNALAIYVFSSLKQKVQILVFYIDNTFNM